MKSRSLLLAASVVTLSSACGHPPADEDKRGDTELADTDSVDTESVDTDAPDTDGATSDTDYYRMALVTGQARVAPNATWSGTTQRIVQVAQRVPLSSASAAPHLSIDCIFGYGVTSVATLETEALCPSCEFGFEVKMNTRTDQLHAMTGALPDYAGCEDAFAPLGGIPRLLPNRKFFFSSQYGALYYENAGTLVQYTDDVQFVGGNLTYRKYLYQLPY